MSNEQFNLRRLVCVLHFKWPSELPATPTSIFNFYLHCLVCIPSYSNRNWKSQMPTFGPQQTYQSYGWIIALFRWHPFVVDLSNSTKISTNSLTMPSDFYSTYKKCLFQPDGKHAPGISKGVEGIHERGHLWIFLSYLSFSYFKK